MKTLHDIDVAGKRVLVRCPLNVPVNEKGEITDDFRIQQALPTIRYLMEKKAKVILMSHFDPDSTGVADKRYTLLPMAQRLSDLLSITVEKADDCVGPDVEVAVNKLQPGQVMVLENLRFHQEETENGAEFAKQLSFLGDLYVNDDFATCHRKHASMVGVPKLLPHAAGLLLEKEINALDKILNNPEHPMVAVVGGAKVETKSKFINNISQQADTVILGGLLAAETKEKGIQLANPEKVVIPVGDLKTLDISEETIQLFREKILTAKTVLWNGAVGKFEDAQYAKGTKAIADAIIESGAFSVVGGGETVEFLEKEHILDKFSHVSTGGGAMLNYLSGDELPGLAALT